MKPLASFQMAALPKLAELRGRALALGLDPVPFGRSRKALLEAIEAERKRQFPPPRLVKHAEALSPPRVVELTPDGKIVFPEDR